jgi:TolA-binding protein
MKNKNLIFFALLAVSLFSQKEGLASVRQINGKWTDDKYAPTFTVEQHFELGYALTQQKKWADSLNNFLIITHHFPEAACYADSLFFAGVCYYFLGDYQLSNTHFSRYLNEKVELKYFENVFQFKYYIAEAFRMGAKKHIFNAPSFPKMLSGKEQALEIYDEVISSLPHQELGAKALFGKAQLLRNQRKYKESIETLQSLIKRFPKNSKAPESYLEISGIYLEESIQDAQNPDLISLANLSLSHFKKDFPGDERISLGEKNIVCMEEAFAASLYETGRFYEKKKKPKASLIYYEEALKKYPQSESAQKCQERVLALKTD